MKSVFVGFLVVLVAINEARSGLVTQNYVDTIVSVLQSDLNTKANDADVVHLAGNETISGIKTFTEPVLINSQHAGQPIMTLTGTGQTIYFNLVRTDGSEAVLESGKYVSLFGTRTNHPMEIRTNYETRVIIGTDGSVVLSTAPSPADNSNQVATTAWVNERIKTLCGAE